MECVSFAGKDGPSHIRFPGATGNRVASILFVLYTPMLEIRSLPNIVRLIDCVSIKGKDRPSHIRFPGATGNCDGNTPFVLLHANARYPVTTQY